MMSEKKKPGRKPTNKLSKKQQEVLDFIKQNILTNGYPPSVREICKAVQLSSTSSVHAHLTSLERKGYIVKDPTKPRTIQVVDDSFQMARHNVVNIPVVGRVAAGTPILAQENIETYFPLASEFVPVNECFMLVVKGNSMINVGILDGDRLIVEKQNTASNGEIVVAMVEDSESLEAAVTVKTFYKEEDHIRLQPENDTMEPIIVSDCEIVGKVVGLYRSFR